MPISDWLSAGVYSLGATQIALKAQGVASTRRKQIAGLAGARFEHNAIVCVKFCKAGRPDRLAKRLRAEWFSCAP
jgi:hypothetical protein